MVKEQERAVQNVQEGTTVGRKPTFHPNTKWLEV